MTASKPSSRRYVGWRCRLYPRPSQEEQLSRCRNGLRELSNTLLASSQLQYSQTGRRMSLAELRALAREWQRQPEHRECPATATYRLASDLDRAYRNWFRGNGRRGGRGFPQFKGIGREPGIYFSNQGLRFESRRVWLPKYGWVRWKGGDLPAHRLPGPSARKTRGLLSGRAWLDAGGRWMLSCLFECGALEPRAPTAEKATVRQNGSKMTVVLDDGSPRVIREGRGLRSARRRLARLEQELARAQPGSKGRARTMARLRNQARKIRNRQQDLQHQTTTRTVRDAGVIEVEGAGSELLRQLEYKAEWHGRRLKVRRGPPEPGTGKPPRARRPGSRSLKRESRTRGSEALWPSAKAGTNQGVGKEADGGPLAADARG